MMRNCYEIVYIYKKNDCVLKQSTYRLFLLFIYYNIVSAYSISDRNNCF